MSKKEMTPWTPPIWEVSDNAAIRAMIAGEASPEQQQRGMKFIVEKLCGTYDFHYYAKSERDTAFALGRAFVGQQIVAAPFKLRVVQEARRKSGRSRDSG